MKRFVVGVALTALAACSQNDAPSEQLAAEAEKMVEVATGDETPAPAGPGPLAPRNECGDLPGATPFLAMLRYAVEVRDTDVLVALAADDVKLSFGGDGGSDTLRKDLDADGSTLWDEISDLTALGCAANGQGGITLPWYFEQKIEGDPFMTMIALGEEVPVHAKPLASSPRIASLSWEAVEVDGDEVADQTAKPAGEGDQTRWRKIHLAAQAEQEAVEGYVRARQLRSVIDYRLIASSRNGRWRITALIAGD